MTDPGMWTCRYPGCDQFPATATGPGRPHLYCARPDHNPGTAFRERRRLEQQPALAHSLEGTSTAMTTPTGRRPERITPGTALQIIDIHDPRTGQFARQIVMRGTPEQVRAYALRDFYHPSQHQWHRLTVTANPALATREDKLTHIHECGLCVVDEESAGHLPTDTDEDLADFIAACHYTAYTAAHP